MPGNATVYAIAIETAASRDKPVANQFWRDILSNNDGK